MTVCVATIFENGIFGASDRMLTAGNIQFQPPRPKIWALTTSIVAMIAGDVSIQAEIFNEVHPIINDRINREPENWWRVKDVAEIYCDQYTKLRSKLAAKKYLAPLGLDANTFISRQSEMNPDLVRKLSAGLIDHQIPDTEVIFAGIDTLGPHLYVVRNGSISCEDSVGFAAIGVGNWHAESLLMGAGHSRSANASRALYLTFAAKKRAEIAPGVGSETDMFIFELRLGSYARVYEHIIQDLEKFYQNSLIERQRLNTEVEEKVKQYVDNLAETAADKQPVQGVSEAKTTLFDTEVEKTEPEK